MAGNFGTVEIWLKMREPNWALMCFGIVGPAMRDLGYLEAGNAELAIESLRNVKSVCDMAMMCEYTGIEVKSPYDWKSPNESPIGL